MQRSTTFDTLLANCTTVEQILSLAGHALYNRYSTSAFIVTTVDADGAQIFSPNIEVWAGGQQIGEQQSEQQTVVSFAAKISVGHQTSPTPWLSVLPIGDVADTPNGSFA
jgi:hypothetical protein